VAKMDKKMLALARRQHGLLERAQLHDGGWDDSAVRRWIVEGRLERLHSGVYRVGGVPATPRQALLAACLAGGPGVVASHRAAASLWGILDGELPIEVTVLRQRKPRVRGAILHRSTDLVPHHILEVDGVPVTSPSRTLVDLGAVVPRWQVADALERSLVSRLLSPVEADEILSTVGRRGRSGVGALRAVLDERALGQGIPDGLLEPRMARLLREWGLPAGAFQHEIRDRSGAFVARVDFAWPDRRLVVEVDGFSAHGTPKAMTADLARQNRLVALGWTVFRFTWEQVVRRPKEVVAQLRPVLGSVSTP
jgi:hypothetical protein